MSNPETAAHAVRNTQLSLSYLTGKKSEKSISKSILAAKRKLRRLYVLDNMRRGK